MYLHCMCIRYTVFFDTEQVTEVVLGEVPFGILVVIDHSVGQRFLVGLSLENLFLYSSSLQRK